MDGVGTLIVQPKYPNDPLPEVVDDFIAECAKDCPEHTIVVTKEEPWAPQVSAWEMLTVWLPAGISVVEVAKYVVKFSLWLQKRREQTAGMRGHTIQIYGSDGTPIKSVSISRSRNEVIEEEADPREPRRLPAGR
jgi:hypothetical protein